MLEDVQELMKEGEGVNQQLFRIFGVIPLYLAAGKGHEAVAVCLVASKAAVDAADT